MTTVLRRLSTVPLPLRGGWLARVALRAGALTLVAGLLPSDGSAAGPAGSRPPTAQAPCSAQSTAPVACAHLAVVVNRSNPLSTLSRGELLAIFRGEKPIWPHGRRITLALREPGQPERAAALRQIYGMSEADLTRHFLHQTFTGGSAAGPRSLATADGVKRFIFNVPGAIGLIRLADVDGTVKTITIDGVAPGEPGYLLVMDQS